MTGSAVSSTRALRPGLRFRWLFCRPVKVKSLVCLNQCARKRPSYLCPVIMETSFASQTPNPTLVIPRSLLHGFFTLSVRPRYAHGTGRLRPRGCVWPTDSAECVCTYTYTYKRAKRSKLRTIHAVMMLSFFAVLYKYIYIYSFMRA